MKKTIELSDDTAKKIYPSAGPEMKLILEENFGKSMFFNNPMEYIRSIEDAELATGDKLVINPTDTPDEISYKKAKLFAKALNNDPNFPNWNDPSQPKYIVYAKKSGSGLSYHAYDHTYTSTGVGSRLVFKDPAYGRYMIEQFGEEVKHYYFKY